MGLRPREEWKTTTDKDKLIEAMTAALETIPGISTNFSQPIKDNVDEALAGTKGELAIKLFGPDNFVMDAKAREIVEVLRTIRGVALPAVYALFTRHRAAHFSKSSESSC